jgi:hypothetical protein
VLTRFGANDRNNLSLVDPHLVHSFQADMAIITGIDFGVSPRARLAGYFYNDGTPGEGRVGDIFAEIGVRPNGFRVVVAFLVIRCTNSDCSSSSTLIFDDQTFGLVAPGETHTLSLAWNGQSFTFGVDGRTVTVDPTGSAPVVAPPRSGATRVLETCVTEIDHPAKGAFIAATFDNVFVNGTLYDDFAAATIDLTKWVEGEIVRRIEQGMLTSALTQRGLDGSDTLRFIDPSTITGFHADVTLRQQRPVAVVPVRRPGSSALSITTVRPGRARRATSWQRSGAAIAARPWTLPS